MALTFTTPLPANYSVNQNNNITLTVEVSSDQPSLSAVTFQWFNPQFGSTGKATGVHPNYTTTLNFPAYTQDITGIINVTLIEYDDDGNPVDSGITSQTNAIVYPEDYVPERLINGRTVAEHHRMRLLGYI